MKHKTTRDSLTLIAENDTDRIALAEILANHKRGAFEPHPAIVETLELLDDGDMWFANAVAGHFNITPTAANQRLRKLCDLGLLTRERQPTTGPGSAHLYGYRKADT